MRAGYSDISFRRYKAMQRKVSSNKLRSLRLLFKFATFVFLFFLGSETAFAFSQIAFPIANNGDYDYSDISVFFPNTNTINCAYVLYQATYPTVNTPKYQNGGSTCDLYRSGSSGALAGYSNMNTFWSDQIGGSAPDGDYWFAIRINGGTSGIGTNYDYYAVFDRTSGQWNYEIPPPPISSITITEPTEQTYISNPIEFAGTYDNIDTFDQIQFDLSWNNSMNINMQSIDIPLTNGNDLPFFVSRNLPFQGNYQLRMRLWDTANATSSAWTDYINFGLGTTTVATSTQPGSPLPTAECEAFEVLGVPIPDFACAIKQGIAWLFYPSEDSVTNFKSLTLRNSLPFSYAYDVGTLRDELFDSTETATSTVAVDTPIGTITFFSKAQIEAIPLSSTVKTILGWLLWIITAEFIYRKIIKVHDANTHA